MNYFILILFTFFSSCSSKLKTEFVTPPLEPSAKDESTIDSPTESENEIEHDDPWNFYSEAEIKSHRDRAINNDLCKVQPKGFHLYNSKHCDLEKPNSITYGDFDGDLKSDSFAVLRNYKTKRLSFYIWFGGESQPTSLDSFKIFRSQNKKFDELNMDSFFEGNANKTNFSFKLGKTLDYPVEMEYFAATATATAKDYFQGNNKYSVKRSILFEAAGQTMDIRLYIFDKKRKKAIIDKLNLM